MITGARVDMGPPSFDSESLPANVEGPGPVIDLPLTVDGIDLKLTLVSVGNPHTIHYIVSDPASFPLERIGPLVEKHPLFPRRTNFQVGQVLDRGHVKHGVWERGSGITLTSGTSDGAAARTATASTSATTKTSSTRSPGPGCGVRGPAPARNSGKIARTHTT